MIEIGEREKKQRKSILKIASLIQGDEGNGYTEE